TGGFPWSRGALLAIDNSHVNTECGSQSRSRIRPRQPPHAGKNYPLLANGGGKCPRPPGAAHSKPGNEPVTCPSVIHLEGRGRGCCSGGAAWEPGLSDDELAARSVLVDAFRRSTRRERRADPAAARGQGGNSAAQLTGS